MSHAMSHAERLALAKAISTDLRRRERSNLVAVGLYGSVSRGEDRTHSDVDLLVVVRRKRAGIRHVVRDGILVTVLQETPQEARAEVTGTRPGLNDALGGWRSMQALYDPSGLLRDLTDRARRPTREQFREAAHQHLIETYEDRGKVLNAVASGDLDEAREMAIWYSGAAMGALFDTEGHVLRTGRRAFIEIGRYGALGRDLRRLRYEALSLSEILRLTERTWARLLYRARVNRVPIPEFVGRRPSS